LLLARICGLTVVGEVVLAAGADANATSYNGQSPLMRAYRDGRRRTGQVQILASKMNVSRHSSEFLAPCSPAMVRLRIDRRSI
jgi:hypothetical protein